MSRVTLVGECNPYSVLPEFALYPAPGGAAGARLAAILGLTRLEYLRRFDRANLCPTRWEAGEARLNTAPLAQPGRRLVLLGAKVARAFGVPYVPFRPPSRHLSGATYVVLPHPSGRCRAWNEPGARDHAREAVRALEAYVVGGR